MPRIRRNFIALPRDGVIPPSSYGVLYLYLDQPLFYRDALLSLTGEDILDQTPFHAVVDYVIGILREQDHTMMTFPIGQLPFIGANAAFNRLACKYRDGRAAYLQELLLKTPETAFFHATQEFAYYHGALWGFLTYDPAVLPSDRLAEPPNLQYYDDSGFVHYRDAKSDMTLSLVCGPWSGYNGHRRAQGPCDRLETFSGAGHFVMTVNGQTLLMSPDGGYRLRSAIRSCLLVDGKGRHGDIDYPMSIPSYRHRGEDIQFARWDADARTGWIRLNLAPVYPDDLGLASYTRDFLIREGEAVICRDCVTFSRPRRLAWLFQSSREIGIARESGNVCRIGGSPWLRIEARPAGFQLDTSVKETEVVWSYTSAAGFKPFAHACFESIEPMTTACVDFVLTWER